MTVDGKRQLIVPYTLDANDMRFAIQAGFTAGDQFFAYLKDSFDVLYEEGRRGAPKMMSVGPALPAGRPAGPRRGAGPLPRLCRSSTRRSGSAAASTSPGTGTSTTETRRESR